MLKADPPSNDMKLQLLQEIAAESGLNAYDKVSLLYASVIVLHF